MTPLTYHSTFHLSVQLISEYSKEHWKSLRSRIYLRVFPPWLTSALICYISISCISTQQSFSQHSTHSKEARAFYWVSICSRLEWGRLVLLFQSFVSSQLLSRLLDVSRRVLPPTWERDPVPSLLLLQQQTWGQQGEGEIQSQVIVCDSLSSRLLSSPVRGSAPRTRWWAASS